MLGIRKCLGFETILAKPPADSVLAPISENVKTGPTIQKDIPTDSIRPSHREVSHSCHWALEKIPRMGASKGTRG